MAKTYYVTNKRVNTYIEVLMPRFLTKTEFINCIETELIELNKYSSENKNQIRFFNKILLRTTVNL